ncbi:MAG: peptidyl-prolyl cis-trans isomerase [Myxococcales bacterium FL481]|nr:MAG: peptidyl-prolyl cis-trans isomerase [Myxococcales bacterium FL481]
MNTVRPPRPTSFSWLREPLLHFAVLGAAVFLLYREASSDRDDQRMIRVDERKRQELAAMFEQRHRRPPDHDELNGAVAQWVNAEILYREGKALGLDQYDSTMREMIISKARAMIQGQVAPSEPTDAVLREHYEAHATSYQLPASVTFEQMVVSPREPNAAQVAAALVESATAGDTRQRPVQRLEQRTAEQIEMVYGADFSRRLFALAPGAWEAIESSRGWHVIHVVSLTPPQARPFEQVRVQVDHDWRNGEKRKRYQQALEQIRLDYEIEVGSGTDA